MNPEPQIDSNHRLAVLETLKQEFPGQHIVLLTLDSEGRIHFTFTMHRLAVAGILDAASVELRGQK